MEIKDIDIDKTRKYVVAILLIVVIFLLRDTFWTLIATLLNTFGIGVADELPPGLLFFIIAALFFGFALVVTMVIQKKKLTRTIKPADIISKGFCDICCNPRAKNVLSMQYKEEGKDDATIYVCERCRNEVNEIREGEKNNGQK